MKTKLLLLIFFVSTIYANEVKINSIGLNVGINHSSYDQKDKAGTISIGDKPDKSFNSIELYTTLSGICKKNDIKPYISYSYSSNDELNHQYLLLGLNKYYNPSNTKINLMAGIVAGYGQLDWEYDPLNTAKNINADSNSLIGGLQLGASYPMSQNLFIGINAKFLIHNYETKLNPTAGTLSLIKHKNTNLISIGLEYKF